jgi:hypothetical protein
MAAKRVMDKDSLQFSNTIDHISYHHPRSRMAKRGGLYTSRLGCGQPTDPLAQFSCVILGVDSEWAGWKCITSLGIGFWWKEGGVPAAFEDINFLVIGICYYAFL